MGYSTVTLVSQVIAQALTSQTPDTLDQLGDLMNIGNTLDSNNVTAAVMNTFIADADADINSDVSVMYGVPLRKKADYETLLETSVFSAATTLVVEDADILVPGDTLIVTDGVNQDDVTVVSLNGTSVTVAPPLTHAYSSLSTRVVRSKYPDPIPFVSSRIAAGNIYDKFFAAQSDKNESNYGKYLRNLARIKLQMILQGAVVLNGQHRIGHLTVNPNTIKAYKLPLDGESYKLDDPGGRS